MVISNWPLTLEQFLALPEAEPALEYGPEGRVSQKVSPTTEHSIVQAEVVTRLNGYAIPRNLGRAFPELRVTLGGLSRVPDVAFYRQERLPRAPDGAWLRYPALPPDVVIEVASPDQARDELLERCRWYITQGTPLALLADPVGRTVTVFEAGRSATLQGSDMLPLDDVLPGLSLTVAEVFRSLTVP
jgi:Uma2 family endonuclease